MLDVGLEPEDGRLWDSYEDKLAWQLVSSETTLWMRLRIAKVKKLVYLKM